MTDRLNDLRTALEALPSILLDDELARGAADALAMVHALDQIRPAPTIIVVSGPGGSGKSTFVNALIGENVAAVSAVRPTTTAITAIGADDVVRIKGATEFVVTDSLPSGVVVVDTPPWDRAEEEISALLAQAALGIVIVTPARYGDDATHGNIAAAASAHDMELIANRLPEGDAERDQIEDAIHERLDIKPLAVFSEGERMQLASSPMDRLPSDEAGKATRRVLAKAAAGSSRKIAAAITANAAQIGEVEAALAETPEPHAAFGAIDTSTWEGARTHLVRVSLDLADAFDTAVERKAGNDLAVRIRRSLGLVDTAAIAGELDEWRTKTTATLVEHARFGLRKKSGTRIIENHGWIAVVNEDEPGPRRLAKMLRGAASDLYADASAELAGVIEAPAVSRRERWEATLREVGAYRPGDLVAAADAITESITPDG